jgi:ribosomal protein S18 acetylase RimI-like enzyme
MPEVWRTRQLNDKAEILAFLQRDPLYAAYAIGDLEPGMFELCTWAGAERDGRLQALVLHFRGMQPPALLLIGDSDGLRATLEQALYPRRVYLTFRSEHLSVSRELYQWDEVMPMWRMVLQPRRFRPVAGECMRLTPADIEDLRALYAHGGADAFQFYQLQQGVFCGLAVGGQLVAAAGTHLVSPSYGVAAVGNVFTHPAHRGHGHGAQVTSAVVCALLGQGIDDIVLNVHQDNIVAVHLYEKLGFERYCPFFEGLARARERRRASGT